MHYPVGMDRTVDAALAWLLEGRDDGPAGYWGDAPWPLARAASGAGFEILGLDPVRARALTPARPAGTLRLSRAAPPADADLARLWVEQSVGDAAALAVRSACRPDARVRWRTPTTAVAAARVVEVLSTRFTLLHHALAEGALVLELSCGDEAARADSWARLGSSDGLLALTEALRAELETRLHRAEQSARIAAREGVERAAREAARRRGEIRRLRAELDRARGELALLRRSTRYRLAHALTLATRSGREAIRLPRRLLNLVQDRGRPVAERSDRSPKIAATRARLLEDLDRWAAHVRDRGGGDAVFMLSGTTFVNPIRANRPIRLTRVLRERGIPVLFGFHGKLSDDDLPDNPDPGLVQLPIELTETLIDRLPELDLGPSRRIFVVSYPHPCVVGTLGRFAAAGWALVYDCRDDWEEFAKVGAAAWYDPAVERHVVAECDRSFAVSWPLRDKIRAFAPHRRIETSPNAYDPAFRSSDYRRAPTDEVVVGYFGHLTSRWFDWTALARIARARPSWRFEIVGHQAPERPGTPSNVHLLGPKTHPEICRLAERWRVGIIPFKPSRLADAVDPIKIYEYFGLGLPVVSFRMPQIATYPHTETVGTVPEFVAALDRAVERPVDPDRLAAFLAENTWAHRADQLLEAGRAALECPPFEKLLHAEAAG